MRILQLFSIFLLIFAFVPATYAQETPNDGWTIYHSETDLFRVKMPDNAVETMSPFRVGIDRLLMDSEVTASLDDDRVRYTIETSQTFGSNFNNALKNTLISREIEHIKTQYQDQDAIIHNTGMIEHDREYAGEIHLSYFDAELGERQSRRSIVTLTKNTRTVHSVTGPDAEMFSLKTRDFLGSLKFKSIKKLQSDKEQEWSPLKSPFSLFELQVPPVVPPYVVASPSIQSNDKTEVISQVFIDPIWRQNIYYKVYGHRFGVTLSRDNVQQVMIKNHIRKHGRNPRDLEFGQSFAGDRPSLEVTYNINGPKGFEYINTVRLRALYRDNMLVIQEMMGPGYLVDSDFMRNTYDLIDFFPQDAFKKQAIETLQGLMAQ